MLLFWKQSRRRICWRKKLIDVFEGHFFGFEFVVSETVDWYLLDKRLPSQYQYNKYKLKKGFTHKWNISILGEMFSKFSIFSSLILEKTLIFSANFCFCWHSLASIKETTALLEYLIHFYPDVAFCVRYECYWDWIVVQMQAVSDASITDQSSLCFLLINTAEWGLLSA